MNRTTFALIIAGVAVVSGLTGSWIGAEYAMERRQGQEKADALARFNATPTCLEPATTEASARGCIATAAMLADNIRSKMAEWQGRDASPLVEEAKIDAGNMAATARQKLERGQAYTGDIGLIRKDIPGILSTIQAAEAWVHR